MDFSISIELPTFSVTVPTELPTTVNKDGEVIVADNAAIINNSDGTIVVTAFNLEVADGWNLVSFNQEDIGITDFAVRLNETKSNSQGFHFEPFTLDKGTSQPLDYEMKFIHRKKELQESVAEVSFIVAWVGDHTISSSQAVGIHGDPIMHFGDTVQLSLTEVPEYSTVVWSSSNEDVATVDQNGLVTAGTIPGDTYISCSVDGATSIYKMQLYGANGRLKQDAVITDGVVVIPKHYKGEDGKWYTCTDVWALGIPRFTEIYIPNSVTSISSSVSNLSGGVLYYEGTEEEWNRVTNGVTSNSVYTPDSIVFNYVL